MSKRAQAELHPNWPLLAGLRFVLALIVAMLHVSFEVADGTFVYYRKFGGSAAVAIFLLVSGYCMAHSYGKEPEGFYRRRFWRIWPVADLARLCICRPACSSAVPHLGK